MNEDIMRIDTALVARGLAPSRERARKLIEAGLVTVNGTAVDKPSRKVCESDALAVSGEVLPYVSRGGLKLEKALQVFPVTVEGKVCLDIGSSTGGFTDCMLQNGAKRVYAIDVGRGQLDWKLRNDPRVVSMEKTNIRYVEPDDLPEYASFASIDVSFISLIKVLIPVRNLLEEDGEIICLIKPQFEAGRDQVGKHGVVRDPLIQIDVIRRITAYARTAGLEPVRLDYSPIRGPEGNIEYLCCLKKKASESDPEVTEEDILKAVKEAHETLS